MYDAGMNTCREAGQNEAPVLYFSRGNGRAHAITDIEIARALSGLRKDLNFQFVSYATGAETFRQNGYQIIDLGLPEFPSIYQILVGVGRLIEVARPKAVISHEGFPVLPASKVFDLPVVLITHWFLKVEHPFMQALDYVDRVVFIEEPDLFEEPPNVKGKVVYVGPAVRKFAFTKDLRAKAREQLEFPQERLIVLVLPGCLAEENVPILDVVISAFEALRHKDKSLVWLAGNEYGAISKRLSRRPNVIVKETDWQIDRLMASSDLIINKATYNTTIELTALAIPSITILSDQRYSWIDEAFAKRNPTTRIVRTRDLTQRRLALCMKRALETNRSGKKSNIGSKAPQSGLWPYSNGIQRAAETIASFLS